MLLDIDLNFTHPGRVYNPGDTITCEIIVESTFKIKCKYVKVRLRCPYRKSSAEKFRIYEIARQSTGGIEAENFVLQRGRNQFFVTCKIPDVSHATFEEYSNIIRCSFKVTVNANWLPKRCCLDWFVLEPLTAAEKVFDKIENRTYNVFNSISSKIRCLMAKKKCKA